LNASQVQTRIKFAHAQKSGAQPFRTQQLNQAAINILISSTDERTSLVADYSDGLVPENKTQSCEWVCE